MKNKSNNNSRRRFLAYLTAAVGGGGLASAGWMFLSSMRPAADKGLHKIAVDISKLQPGQILTVSFQNKPIYILRRTEEMMQALNNTNPLLRDPQSIESAQPEQARNSA
jgi:ubiquinol-cytochrome c reductase iron-sulfur subunit